MNPVALYTLARLGLFVLALAVFAVAGAGRLTALVGAALVSMLISYVALGSLRDKVAERVAARVETRRARRPEPEDDELE